MKEEENFIEKTLKTYFLSIGLKRTKRTGWVDSNIKESESVADHTYGVLILVLLLYKKFNLQLDTMLKMALIHDIGESIIGDITPKEMDKYHTKSKIEEEAINTIFNGLADTNELIELWKDYEYARTKEGVILKQIDKLEMALQALSYSTEQEINITDFLNTANEKIENIFLLKVLEVSRGKYNSSE
jgi:putative hydrolases of HD superfamily